MRMAKTITALKTHKRVIVWSLIFAYAVLLLVHPDESGRFYTLFFGAIPVVLIASQVFWIRRVGKLGKRLISSKRWRWGFGAAGLTIYFSLLAYYLFSGGEMFKGTGLTLRSALLEAPFELWLLGSFLGFLVALLLWAADRVARVVSWSFKKLIICRRPELPFPSRRRFLEQTAIALSAAPFVAGTYGLFYGRLNLETTHKQIKLRRLPKAFNGFRIVQLSDLHISAFMSAVEIRKYAAIAQQQKADLVVLTGDYITWDETAQGVVVEALSGLKAPFGVFGCLGNHEIYAAPPHSITSSASAINAGGSVLNLIGVDYESRRGRVEAPGHSVREYLPGIEQLLLPDTVNILLSHNPNTFDRAAELGIDLSLGGHTHGGQLTLEFIHPSLWPSRLITPYVRGLFQKGESQLYVNRGIGTVDYPSRFGSRPEITLFELVRGL